MINISEEEILKAIKEYEELAKKLGLKLNPDKEHVRTIVRALLVNEKLYGKRYCPCKLERTEENVCPCRDLQEYIKKYGKCKCGLFVKG